MAVNHIFTVDVEDWYHSSLDIFKDTNVQHGTKPLESVVDNTLTTLALLAESNNKATFFVLGTVAQYYPDLVKEILNQGHEVATHGYAHELVYNLTPQSFEMDIKKSLDLISQAGCTEVTGYRAPYWSIKKQNLWALEVLQKMGFRYDSSIFPISRGLYGIPDANPCIHRTNDTFWEFPPATIRCLGRNWPIAGGGYLRLLPYGIIQRAIRTATNDQMRVFYCHPYELDPTDMQLQHRVKSLSSAVYYVQQIIGRKSNPDKLKRLIRENRFISIKEALCELEQKKNATPCAS